MLRSSYWASNRNRNHIVKAIENSLCFSVFVHDIQIGFARVVTDSCTFAWIADVFIEPNHQGQRLGKQLVEFILEHPAIKDTGQQLLQTRDAHTLYERFGFVRSEVMSRGSE